MRIVLINAPLKSTVCDYSIGHQIPLGLLMVGGPLIDAGFEVTMLDAACDHLSDQRIAEYVCEAQADVVMTSHVGSTQAHPCCVRMLAAIKAARPEVITVYGGVHPSYHDKEILAEHPEVDIIVRGEGEATALALVQALVDKSSQSEVQGISCCSGGMVIRNRQRPPIEDFTPYRIAWELVQDWDKYQAFGRGRAAVVQFSRGCPHSCTYCGQWMFWKRWRHRRVTQFVDEMEMLHRDHGVNYFWLADENPTTDKEIWRSVLEEIIRRDLGIGLSATVRASDIVAQADLLPLYKKAGFLYLLIGIETVTDENLTKIHKGMCVEDGYRAVRLLQENNIMSVVDYIFGIEDETPRTLWRGLRGLLRYDGDVVNALFMTPHAWTPLGHALRDAPIVEPDLWKWDYRHQVLGVKHLSPIQLFVWVKLIEVLYHLHPRRFFRMLTVRDRDLRRQLHWTFWHTIPWFLYEAFERPPRVPRQKDTAPILSDARVVDALVPDQWS